MPLFYFVPRTGLEPVTLCLEDRCFKPVTPDTKEDKDWMVFLCPPKVCPPFGYDMIKYDKV